VLVRRTRIGYEKAAQIALAAHRENLSLKEAAIRWAS
jgi:fumarate hydratase class II